MIGINLLSRFRVVIGRVSAIRPHAFVNATKAADVCRMRDVARHSVPDVFRQLVPVHPRGALSGPVWRGPFELLWVTARADKVPVLLELFFVQRNSVQDKKFIPEYLVSEIPGVRAAMFYQQRLGSIGRER